MQSVFFINQAFYDGETLGNNDDIFIHCNNTNVGGKPWDGPMTDVIAMGNDGYSGTESYCEEIQNISITIENEEVSSMMYILGDAQWENNAISIISISNFFKCFIPIVKACDITNLPLIEFLNALACFISCSRSI